MTGFSVAERAALDRATVPTMRGGLAGEIVAAARSGVVPPRRATRGGWRRHGRVLLGAGALVIASATAAATGLLDRLPIHIPGITRVAEAPAPKPEHVVRVEKPRPAPGRAVSLAGIVPVAVPLIDPAPTPAAPWRERRAQRIAAGLPVRPTLVQRALAAKLRGMTPDQRRAAMVEWRRIKALPPAERKLAVAKVRADYLAQHPKMAARYEARLEAKSAAAADGRDPATAVPPAALPQAGPRPPLTPDQRAARRDRWQANGGMDGGALTPDQRAERREQLRQWRIERRAQRLRDGNPPRREGSPPPAR